MLPLSDPSLWPQVHRRDRVLALYGPLGSRRSLPLVGHRATRKQPDQTGPRKTCHKKLEEAMPEGKDSEDHLAPSQSDLRDQSQLHQEQNPKQYKSASQFISQVRLPNQIRNEVTQPQLKHQSAETELMYRNQEEVTRLQQRHPSRPVPALEQILPPRYGRQECHLNVTVTKTTACRDLAAEGRRDLVAMPHIIRTVRYHRPAPRVVCT